MITLRIYVPTKIAEGRRQWYTLKCKGKELLVKNSTTKQKEPSRINAK